MNTRMRTIATTAEIAIACSSHSAARCQNGAGASIKRGGRAGGTLILLLRLVARFCLAKEIALSGVVTPRMKALVVDEHVPQM